MKHRAKKKILFLSIFCILLAAGIIRYAMLNGLLEGEHSMIQWNVSEEAKYGEVIILDEICYYIEKPTVKRVDGQTGKILRYQIPFKVENAFLDQAQDVYIIDKVSVLSAGRVWFPYPPDVTNSKQNRNTKWTLKPREKTSGTVIIDIPEDKPLTDAYEIYCSESYKDGSGGYKVKLTN